MNRTYMGVPSDPDPNQPDNIIKMEFEAVKELVDEKLRSTENTEDLINEVTSLLDELQETCINVLEKYCDVAY